MIDVCTERQHTSTYCCTCRTRRSCPFTSSLRCWCQRLFSALHSFTPLYMAAQENHVDLCKILSNGAKSSITTDVSWLIVCIEWLIVVCTLSVFTLICKRNGWVSCEYWICIHDLVGWLFAVDHGLAIQGHEKIFSLLLEQENRGNVKLPPLHIAAKKDNVNSARLLPQNTGSEDSSTKVRGPLSFLFVFKRICENDYVTFLNSLCNAVMSVNTRLSSCVTAVSS